MLDSSRTIANPAVYIHSEVRTVGELFVKRVERDGSRTAMRRRQDGAWVSISWGEFHDSSAAIASMLVERGVAVGDKVCIVGNTNAEWCEADIAGHLAGAVTLGAYPALLPAQLCYVLDHSDTKVAFVEGRAQLDKVRAIRDKLSKVELVVVWNADEELAAEIAEDEWLLSFEDALAHEVDADALAERRDAVEPENTAIIVYTSGTTGPPKGAMISHANIIAMLAALEGLSQLSRDDVSFAFLPMAHVAERIAGFYGRISSGITGAYATSIASVLDEVQEVQPTLFGSVPRIFEKAYARIMSRVADAPPRRQKIFRWAEGVGRRVVGHWQEGRAVPFGLKLQYKLADKLVFSKLRDVFGGQVNQFVTGAAPIAYEILEFFWAAGFPIYEVYGMTESTTISHVNRQGSVRLGSVGKVLPGIEERIADDGEILVRGPTVFQGYYKNPEATAQTIDEDGWLHTGDIGKRDDDGNLYIVDRKKHIIITAGGKNLTPANIENELKNADPLISQAHVHGDKRKYLTAIVTIGSAEALEYARKRGMVDANEAERIAGELAANPLARPDGLEDITRRVSEDDEIRARIARAVHEANRELPSVETVKRIHILHRDFSIQDDELTPTLKVKRKNIENKFATEVFDKLYEDETFGITVEAPRQ